MKMCNYVIIAVLALVLIIVIVLFVKGGLTGRIAYPQPCAELGMKGYDVLPEYKIEFESNGYKCFESPSMTEAYCCVK